MEYKNQNKFEMQNDKKEKILKKLTNIDPKCENIMDDKILHSYLFAPFTDEKRHMSHNGKSDDFTNFIRIRTGVDGFEKTTITWKELATFYDEDEYDERHETDTNNDEHKQKLGLIEIEINKKHLHNAIELFKRLGMEQTSEQESKRTKRMVRTKMGEYFISIDQWPDLEDFCFLTIEPTGELITSDYEDLCWQLGVVLEEGENKTRTYNFGIDEIYLAELGYEITNKKSVWFPD